MLIGADISSGSLFRSVFVAPAADKSAHPLSGAPHYNVVVLVARRRSDFTRASRTSCPRYSSVRVHIAGNAGTTGLSRYLVAG